MEKLLRLPAVLAARGRKKSAHYQDIKCGVWTVGVAIGPRARAWPQSECEALNAARIAGKGDAEIRKLVRQLEAARKTVDQQPPQIEGA